MTISPNLIKQIKINKNLYQFILFFFAIALINKIYAQESPSNKQYNKIAIQEFNIPATNESLAPSITHTPKNPNGVAISWLQPIDDSDIYQLRMTTILNPITSKPSPPITIAQGDNWFVNWADTPQIIAHPQKNIYFAHWLEQENEGRYDYGIRIIGSQDNGKTWSLPFRPHDDIKKGEHGFVSYYPTTNGFGIIWLDGRHTTGHHNHNEHHNHDNNNSKNDNRMTLRHANLSLSQQESIPPMIISNEIEIDSKTCDCCPTAAAISNNTPIIAYRGRTDTEIRDIYISRLVNNEWSEPQVIHNDNWQIMGCPVNGPSITTNNNDIAAVWFTAANNKPEVKIAFSNDNGQTFNKPIILDNQAPIGRPQIVAINENKWIIAWLSQNNKIKIQAWQNGKSIAQQEISVTSAGRNIGMPKMIAWNNKAIIVWTDFKSKDSSSVNSSIKGAVISPEWNSNHKP